MPRKYVNLFKALYNTTTGQVRAYGSLSPQFDISSGVRQGCPASPFLFNFVIDAVLQNTLDEYYHGGVELLPGSRITDLEYADDIALLCEDTEAAQRVLDNLSVSVSYFGMTFAPQKCKVLLQDWPESMPELKLDNVPLEVVNKFVYLGSCFSSNGLADEVTTRIAKARATFANLRHLWRRQDVSLQLKGRVYNTTVRAVLLYGCEAWPTRAEDLRRLSVFDHRCLRNIAGVWWEHRISNIEVRRRVFGTTKLCRPIDAVLDLHRLRWLRHVLRMPSHRLPHRALFAVPGPGWKRRLGGQRITWAKNMKQLTTRLSKAGRCRLPGWDVRDDPHTWLHTLADMAKNRSQWRLCCETLYPPP